MVEGPVTRLLLRLGTVFVLLFIYFPLAVIGLYAFNDDITQAWPIQNWTTKWFEVAFHDPEVRDAFLLSVKAAILATLIALVLGTCLSFVIARYRFFGRQTISFLVVLPIALPGIVTGLALNATIDTVLQPIGIGFGLATIVIGHATFCVVVVFNNVLARLQRTSLSFEEASADLGADSIQTFRLVTLPALGTALLAGGLLAFGLSFDEVIVTVFTAGSDQTLPIWIFTNLARPNQLPIINVVALVVIVISIIPVWAAQKLAGPVEGDEMRTVGIAEP
ncbi:MAG: ABC transporter permease [Thermoleophilia bacterium]|nr:ABC transporter permease [Thermoleophilia bacterium]